MLIMVVTVILITCSFIICYVDWYSLLNVKRFIVGDLDEVVLFSFFFFCINFIFKFLGNVYQALQLPVFNNLILFGGHLVSLVFILVLKQVIPGSLFWVAIVYSAATPVVYFLCYPVTFFWLYPYLAPSIRYFRKEYVKDLLSLGLLFFVIQVMGVVLFSMSNLMISYLFGPEQVTPYNISFRYFSIVTIFFNLIFAPMWSAATDAYARKDMAWISSILRKMQRLMVLIAAGILIMVLCSNVVYRLWVGESVSIPFMMSELMGLYQFIYIYSLSYSYILNGMGKLRVQVFNIVLMAVCFCPLCYFLSSIFGVVGIVIGMCLINLSGAVLNTIQLHLILNEKATGIWLK